MPTVLTIAVATWGITGTEKSKNNWMDCGVEPQTCLERRAYRAIVEVSQGEQFTLDTYIQIVGTLATYRHHRCRNHHMVVKATSIRYPPPVPFDPTLYFAELLATVLYERKPPLKELNS